MAFTHGKNARLWVQQYELTSFFNEFQMAAKAGTAETTVFGKGAKTYIGGLLEGQITAKGYYGAASTDVEDSTFAAALGGPDSQITFSPSGATAAGSRMIVSYAAMTDYTVSAPVTGVVATSLTALADSGLSTGVSLYDPTTAIATITTTNGTAVNDQSTTVVTTTVAAGSNTGNIVNIGTWSNPSAGVLDVASITGFGTSGTAVVVTSGGVAVITYAGTAAGQLTGCVLISGTGTVSTGGNVSLLAGSTGGFVANLHVLTLTGTGTPTVTVTLQHSMDNSTWVTLASFNGGSAISAPGSYSAFVGLGTWVYPYLRAQIVTAGSTISTTVLVAAARQ